MKFMIKTKIEDLFEILTCRFLRIFFLACPQKAPTIHILIFRKPFLSISSFTESSKIYLTLRKFCQFSYLATGHLPPATFQCIAPDYRNAGYIIRKPISPSCKPAPPCRTAGYSYCKAAYSYCTAGSPGFSAPAFWKKALDFRLWALGHIVWRIRS